MTPEQSETALFNAPSHALGRRTFVCPPRVAPLHFPLSSPDIRGTLGLPGIGRKIHEGNGRTELTGETPVVIPSHSMTLRPFRRLYLVLPKGG